MLRPVSTRQLPSHSSRAFPGGSISLIFSRVMIVKFCEAGSSLTASSRRTFVRYCRSDRDTFFFTSESTPVSSTATCAAIAHEAETSKKKRVFNRCFIILGFYKFGESQTVQLLRECKRNSHGRITLRHFSERPRAYGNLDDFIKPAVACI